MFIRSAAFYDDFYSWKDYQAEAERVHQVVQDRVPTAGTLLDVACGTGQHLKHLNNHYDVQGLDMDPQLLALARDRLPHTPLHEADMADFSLRTSFDVVTCLFSSIGYLTSLDRLRRAVRRMTEHVRPGGILLIEPWFSPDQWQDGHIGALFIDKQDVKAARMNVARSEGRISVLEFHYLVTTSQGVEYFTEEHRLYLFAEGEYRQALAEAGLQIDYDEEGLEGRGLYIGTKP